MVVRHEVSILMLFALSASPTVRLSAQADPDRAVAGGGGVPSGYHARTDRNAAMTNVKVATMGTGMHFTLGPAVIVWRDADDHGRAQRSASRCPSSRPSRSSSRRCGRC